MRNRSFLVRFWCWTAAFALGADALELNAQDARFDPRSVVATGLAGGVFVEHADLDGDGDPDVLAATPDADAIYWYENNADIDPAFTISHLAAGNIFAARTIVACDLDADGDLDLAAGVSTVDGRVKWYESDGLAPPAFSERDVGPRPVNTVSAVMTDAACADLDSDGAPDIVASFWTAGSATQGHIVWYRSNGAVPPVFTKLELPSPQGSLERVERIVVVDLDGDGDEDIAAVSRAVFGGGIPGALVMWTNSGGPSPLFVPQVLDAGLVRPLDIDAALLNTDGRPDLIVADEATGLVRGYRNLGGSPAAFISSTLAAAAGARSVRAGDLVGSQRPDLVVGSDSQPLLLENTSGVVFAFGQSTIDSSDGPAASIALGDLDQDNDLDLTIGYGASQRIRWVEQVQPILNTTSGQLSANIDAAVSSAGPGDTLVVAREHLASPIDTLLPPIPLRFDLPDGLRTDARGSLVVQDLLELAADPVSTIEFHGYLAALPSADLLIDSTTPAVITGVAELTTGGTTTVAAGLAVALEHTLIVREIARDDIVSVTSLLRDPQSVVLFSPIRHGLPALAAVGGEPGGDALVTPAGLTVFLQTPNGPDDWAGIAVNPGQSGTHRWLASGDLDRDGADDLVTVFQPLVGPTQLVVHSSDGLDTPAFVSTTIDASPPEGPMSIIDFNRDGRTDIVTIAGYYRQLSTGGYAFEPFGFDSSEVGFGLAVRDFDRNGTIDVAVHSAILEQATDRRVGYTFRLLLSSGGELPTFSEVVIAAIDRSGDPTCIGDCYPSRQFLAVNTNTVHATDIDHDMRPDLVLTEDAGLRLYKNALDTIGLPVVFADGGFPWAAVESIDDDRDGDTDLVIASPSKSFLAILENTDGLGTGFAARDLLRPVERARSIAVGDLNNDDIDDIAFVSTGFGIIAAAERVPPGTISVENGVLHSGVGVQLTSGTLRITDATVSANGALHIENNATVSGTGVIAADVNNAGTIQPLPTLSVDGSYEQRSEIDASDTGVLRSMLLSPVAATRLIVQGQASLDGALIVEGDQSTSFVPGTPPIPVLEADSIEPGVDRFTVVLTPPTTIVVGGKPTPGTTRIGYREIAGNSGVDLLPRFDRGPDLSRTGFDAIGTPSDGVLFDLAGSPVGGPDGVLDAVVAYPTTDEFPSGAIAVFLGVDSGQAFEFVPLGTYAGKNADAPVAVEAGDFDGDGTPEIAFGNRGDGFQTNTVHFLSIDPSKQEPITDSVIPPVNLPRDLVIRDLARVPPPSTFNRRGPLPQFSLVVLADTALMGQATVATFDPIIDDWESCDIDVCDDPDSVDPIDMDGASPVLGVGFAASSQDDDKVVVLSNTGGMPDSFPAQIFSVGANPGELRAADLNNDGFPDIAVVNEIGGSISVLLNTPDGASPGGRTLASHLEFSLRTNPGDPDPLPTSIAVADLDDDGDLDLAFVSSNGADQRAVRWLESQFAETGEVLYDAAADLPEQPTGVPLLVREADAGLPSGVLLNDDLVVLVDTEASSSRGPAAVSVHEAVQSFPPCLADVNGDGAASPPDFTAWVAAFNLGLPTADQNGDGLVMPDDFTAWVANYTAGCP